MMKMLPIPPGIAEATSALSALQPKPRTPEEQALEAAGYNPDSGMRPATPEETMNSQALALPPVPKPAAPTPPAAPVATSTPAPAPSLPAPEIAPQTSNPAPTPTMQDSLGPEYNDAARKALYENLASRAKSGLIGAAFAGFGDTISNAYGKGSQKTMGDTLERTRQSGEAEKAEFEAGRKGKLEGVSTDLALKKAGREEHEYNDDNDPTSLKSQAAVSLAQKMKMPGVVPGKTSYADVNKLLPIQKDLLTAEANAIARAQAAADRSKNQKDANDLKQEKFLQRHGENLTKGGMGELINAYNELAPQMQSGRDVAGIGAWDSHVPAVLTSTQGQKNRERLQQMANVILKQRSGAAVSDQEYRRFLLEMQAGGMPTERAIRAHLGQIGTDLRTIMGGYESSLTPEMLAEYKSRPGAIKSEDIVPASAGTGFDDAKAKRLAELRAKKAAGTLQR